MKVRIAWLFFLSVWAASLPTGVSAWELTKNFNAGRIGDKAEKTSDGFDGAAGGSSYSSDQVAEGRASARVSIKKGSSGWGTFGGLINFPKKVYAGENLWLQMYIYIPTSFNIDTDHGSLKTIRFRTSKSDGDNGGYLDIQTIDEGTSSKAFRMIKEMTSGTGWMTFGDAGSFTKNRWHKITVQLRTDNVTVDNGGASFVKVWLDGVLITHNTRVNTLSQKGDYMTHLYLFTYWNGDAPQDQHLWVDDIRLATGFPSWAVGIDDTVSSPPVSVTTRLIVRGKSGT